MRADGLAAVAAEEGAPCRGQCHNAAFRVGPWAFAFDGEGGEAAGGVETVGSECARGTFADATATVEAGACRRFVGFDFESGEYFGEEDEAAGSVYDDTTVAAATTYAGAEGPVTFRDWGGVDADAVVASEVLLQFCYRFFEDFAKYVMIIFAVCVSGYHWE